MNEELYLKEDSDLLKEIEAIGPQPTDMEERKRQINVIQIKTNLRSRKTMIDLDQSNKNYSKVIGFFAIVQIAIAGLGLVLEIKGYQDQLFSFFVATVFIVIVYWIAMQIKDIDVS